MAEITPFLLTFVSMPAALTVIRLLSAVSALTRAFTSAVMAVAVCVIRLLSCDSALSRLLTSEVIRSA